MWSSIDLSSITPPNRWNGFSQRVAPLHPAAEPGQVVVRATHADGEERGAGVEEGLRLGRLTLHADRALDLGGVAAGVGAVPGQDLRLALQGLDIAEGVPDVGVPGDEPQRLLLPAAADQHRDLAGRGGVELRPARLHARQL